MINEQSKFILFIAWSIVWVEEIENSVEMWDHIYEDDTIKIRVEVHKRAKLRNDFMATSNFQD